MTSITTRSSASSAPNSAERPKRERQTRLQEHLRTVKPGSRSSSPGNKKSSQSLASSSSSASKTVPKSLASAASTAAAVEDETPATTSTASGRPQRKAAAKVVMHEAADSSSDEDVDVEDAAPGPSRSSLVSRTPKKRSSVDSDDDADLAPPIKPSGRPSTGRKMPAQQASRSSSSSPSPSKKRAREPSRLEVGRMNEAEVQNRLAREKAELMSRLAPLGIVPQDHVLDEALRAMSESNTQLTVDSFIRTLASLDTNASPRPQQRPALSVAVPPPGSAKKVSFTTLESPSTPSSLASPSFRLPSPPQAAAAPVAVPGLFYSSPAPHAAPAPRPPLSAVRPGQHLGSISRSFSAPVIPTLGTVGQAQAGALPTPPTAPSSGSLFGAAAGMGRVATRRGNLGALGADSRQQQAAASSPRRSNFGSPAPPPPPAAATPAPSSSLLPAFAFGTASTSSDKPARSAALPSSSSTSRLSKLQSWLAQDDEGTSEDDDDSKGPGATAAGAEAMLKAAAATSKVAAAVPAPAALQLVDAPPSDDDRDAAAGRPRVGGKSIHGLRHRRASEEQQSQPPSLVAASGGQAQGMTTRRRASAKGKGRAVPECVCGASAEGSSSGAVVCAECEVAFHVACVDGASASPFTCSRCAVLADDGPASSGPAKGSDSAAEKEPATAATTPKLADKRVRIGTNTTPHLYQEPTLVASTPVSAPRGNNFSHCADMALAPSPTASPVRRFVPTSPVPSAARLPIPVTPHFGEATIQRAPAPGDYSPTSPQNYRTRASRTRMVSGGAFLNGEWLNSSWDTPSSGAAHAAFGGEADVAQQEQPLRHARATTPVNSGGLSSLVNDDGGAGADEWQLPAWSDVTMTPSRALTSSATPGLSSSASSSVWDTPFAHASPHAHLRRANSSYHAPGVQTLGGHFRTPSQDFLAALERDHPSAAAEAGQGTEAHHMFAQRLFGGHEGPSSPYGDVHQQGAFSSSPQRPPSPLNPRRVPSYGNSHGHAPQYPHHQQHQHQHQQPYKSPSLGDGLANPWSLGGAVAHERMALSASMKPSFSAPGVARFAHGGYGHHHEAAAVEQQMLDDLLV